MQSAPLPLNLPWEKKEEREGCSPSTQGKVRGIRSHHGQLKQRMSCTLWLLAIITEQRKSYQLCTYELLEAAVSKLQVRTGHC